MRIKDPDLAEAFGYLYKDTDGFWYETHVKSHDFDVILEGMYGDADSSNAKFNGSMNQIAQHVGSDDYYLRPYERKVSTR